MANSHRPKLLVCDDEDGIRELLSDSLRFAGFDVSAASDGDDAMRQAERLRPDLVVLDVMMPGRDGFDVARALRARGIDVPVLFLTARDAVDDRIRGLTLGGDDYVTKPFSFEELVARIHAVLRRTGRVSTTPSAQLEYGDLELDDDMHVVRKAGSEVGLSPTEYNLLRYLMQNAGRVVSKQQILEHVWKYDFRGDANVVEACMSYLRKKVDTTEPRLLQTVRGVGYSLRAPR